MNAAGHVNGREVVDVVGCVSKLKVGIFFIIIN
jgi:hypothetical protein